MRGGGQNISIYTLGTLYFKQFDWFVTTMSTSQDVDIYSGVTMAVCGKDRGGNVASKCLLLLEHVKICWPSVEKKPN